MGEAEEDHVVTSVHSTVFKESESLEGKCIKIEGYDFNQGVNYPQLLKSFVTTGFQASNLGDAIQVINQMVSFVPQISSWPVCPCLFIYCCFEAGLCVIE